MAQQNWNYYVAPKGTESRTNTLVGMVQNAANVKSTQLAKEKQATEIKRKEAKRDAEINFNRNEACTEQLSRISEMKAEPGVTKNFIELFSAEFSQMDIDIENNKFDKNNNSSLLALRGVLQGRKGYETGYDYGIRRLSDGSQELWVTGPEVKANRGKEYVVNSIISIKNYKA